MLINEKSEIKKLIVHKIGNKNYNESVIYSEKCINKSENLQNLLLNFFLNSFKIPEYFAFYHEEHLSKNVVYKHLHDFLNDESKLVEISKEIAGYLFDVSDHPKIKKGDFYFVKFENITYNNEITDAVGIFKIENYENFVKVEKSENSIDLVPDFGVNVGKTVDKGCLVLNVDKENGYVVMIVDNTSKGNEALFWTEEFLKIKARANDFLFTTEVMNICKNYVKDFLPEEFEISKAEQADILNKGLQFFKREDNFNFDKFSNEVFGQPEVIESFNNFKQNYISENEIPVKNEFEISENAVKKNQRYLKSVIKLDKNFHIYVHGKKEFIEKGYDHETKMHYYKLFFNDEM